MLVLYHIIDVNLISARMHGIELDLEASRASFECCVKEIKFDKAANRSRCENLLRQFEDTFLGVLLHAWPEPADPVVEALRRLAQTCLAQLQQLKEAIGLVQYNARA
ncbi:hypothetical protein ACI48D_00210 [Massilia sp. LXY-6]|uniref:hypothetical protein n=1 Tax=Massilia sp. LXY-6 TaxID=3379823 RepID=UPI003EE3FD2F